MLVLRDGEYVDVPPPFYKTPHNYDAAAESHRCGEVNLEPSLTIQSMTEDADLNVMMARQGLGGTAMPDNPRIPTYDDFTGVTDFQSALNAVNAAQESFMELPASVRGRFENDPQKFLTFTADPANLPAMVEMGLAVKRPDPPVVEPTKVVIVSGDVPRGTDKKE